jgi:hypothetical protein
MKNLIKLIENQFSNEIKNLGISQVYISFGEVYTKSNYNIPFELYNEIEKKVLLYSHRCIKLALKVKNFKKR